MGLAEQYAQEEWGNDFEETPKHQLAYKYVFEENGHKWSNNNGEAGDNYGSFIAGFEAVERQQDEMMIKFVEWVNKNYTNHVQGTPVVGGYLSERMEDNKVYTLSELLKQFKNEQN
jgi:hypothetical protein